MSLFGPPSEPSVGERILVWVFVLGFVAMALIGFRTVISWLF